eukprot:scaffold10854_cov155-Skeletonema_dohrnii-CCMP3373.AAC.21
MSTSVMFFVQLWLNNQRGLCNVRMSCSLWCQLYLKSRSGGVELEVRRIFCDLQVATTSKLKFDDYQKSLDRPDKIRDHFSNSVDKLEITNFVKSSETKIEHIQLLEGEMLPIRQKELEPWKRYCYTITTNVNGQLEAVDCHIHSHSVKEYVYISLELRKCKWSIQLNLIHQITYDVVATPIRPKRAKSCSEIHLESATLLTRKYMPKLPWNYSSNN